MQLSNESWPLSDTVKITAEISREAFESLKKLAEKRGVSANTVLQQAITNETFIDQTVGESGKLLVEKPDKTFGRITLATG